MKKLLFPIIFYSTIISAQNADPAFNPMTAPDANGIDWSDHILFWKNPSGVQYNECYFSSDSALVANLDTSVRIQNGYPSTVFNSVSVTSLLQNTKYFWRIVEYNASGNTATPVWYFNTQPSAVFNVEFHFDTDLEGWQFFGPLGFYNWTWWNATHTGSLPGEMVFSWDPVFIGDSYIISPEIPCPAGSEVAINFRYFEDWWSDTVVVGSAITYDNGNNWSSIWELQATGNVGPYDFYTWISTEGNFRLGFYYTGDSNNIDFLFVDDIFLFTAMEVAYPPSFLQAEASSIEQKVSLNWNPGVPLGPPTGYKIQRKNGLPEDDSTYIDLVETSAGTHNFDDETVELNQNYTYRIALLSGPGYTSHYGNEATAYVPDVLTQLGTEIQPPADFSLEQNYPNPFNPVTSIQYAVASMQFISLKVYDALGNEVATLIDEQKPAGNYQVEFNGTDLPSGIYFYQLKSRNFIETNKMILLK